MLAKVAGCRELTITDNNNNQQQTNNSFTRLITHHSLFITPFIFTKIYSMESRRSSESLTMMTEIVLPNDTNVFGNLMGGRLMYWMDIAAAIAAQKHFNAPVVTAS